MACGSGSCQHDTAVVVELVGGVLLYYMGLESGTAVYELVNCFFIVAMIEELGKFLGMLILTWKNKNFDHSYDGVIYGVCSSLGFATLENILYVFQGGIGLGILRAVTAIPLHCSCGVIMGYFYSKARENANKGEGAAGNMLIAYFTIDDARIDETCNAYFKWKDLNTYISNNSHRGINMPDAISEPMGCYCLGYLWNRGDEVGDATDPNTGRKIEFKATSRFEGDLSSFGPKCVFDDLVFLRFKLDENLLYIYDLNINSEEFGKYPANKTQTIQEQKNQGRRPHVSLQTLFVDANNLEPDIIFDIRRCKAYNRVSEYYQRLIGK